MPECPGDFPPRVEVNQKDQEPFLREARIIIDQRERSTMKYSSLQIACVAAIGMIAIGVQAGETQAEADFHAA